MLNKTFQISGQPNLEIDVSCNVRIQPSQSSYEIHIEAEGDERALEQLEVLQVSDRTVVVQQSNVIFGNSMSVTQVNGTTYINSGRVVNIGERVVGAVYVNGKKVSGGDVDIEEYDPINVTIWCPPEAILQLDIGGEAVFVSTISLAHTTIDGSGCAQVAIADVEDLIVDVSGCVKMKVANVSGRLSVDAAHSCNLSFDGNYEMVMVDALGACHINTYGTCRGNYVVDASGACHVTHHGKIEGRVKRDVSGVARVNVY